MRSAGSVRHSAGSRPVGARHATRSAADFRPPLRGVRPASLHNGPASLHNSPVPLHNGPPSLHNSPASLHNGPASLHNGPPLPFAAPRRGARPDVGGIA